MSAAQTAWIGRGQCIDHSGGGRSVSAAARRPGAPGPRGPAGARLACVRQYAPTWLGPLAAVVGAAARGGRLEPRGTGDAAAHAAAGAGRGPGSLHGGTPPARRAGGFASGVMSDRRGAGAAGTAAGRSAVTGGGDVPAGRADPAAASAQGGQAGVTAAWALCRRRVRVSAGGGGAGVSGAARADRGGDGRRAAWVHRRTDGHPLFMVHVVEEFARRLADRPASARRCAVGGRGAAGPCNS